jgi:hypothetical protein
MGVLLCVKSGQGAMLPGSGNTPAMQSNAAIFASVPGAAGDFAALGTFGA